MHDNAAVPTSQVTTTDYPEDARARLGLAVTRAREAGGWIRRVDFAEHAGISLRSLVKLEQGSTNVGRRVLEAVGRALPGWTEDTPRMIMEGDAAPTAPAPEPSQPTSVGPAAMYAALEEAGWTAAEEERFQSWKRVLAEAGMELNVTTYLKMRQEYETNRKEQPTPDDGK